MRTGIFGGTFDPVHVGHIKCAEEIMKRFSLDRIIFIPTGDPPHKIIRRITPARDRTAMLEAAVSGMKNMYVSRMECEREGTTYTYDTLKELRAEYGDSEILYMIVGADTLRDIVKWYKSDDVFKMCIFAAMKRPGSGDDEFYAYVKAAEEAGAQVEIADIPEVDISSTDVRKAVRAGEDISRLVPEGVGKYIEENGLYKQHTPDFGEIFADVRTLMSAKRFEHTVGVMNECVRLAHLFGGNAEKCRLAGLLHDCGKELNTQQYKWLGLSGTGTADYDAKEVLLHAKAGVILASERYGITDPEILEAIDCHITGRPEMGLTAQILFVADYTEPGRHGEMYDAVRREIACGSLERAILEECDRVILYNMGKKGARVCTEGVRTRNWIMSRISGVSKEA